MKRAVVIGGGVIGLSCGYSLRKRGFEVTILDAAAPGAGASEGNAGWVTPSLAGPVPSPGVVGDSFRWLLKSDSPLYVKPTLNPRRIKWLLQLLRNCNEPKYRAGLDATARLGERTFELFDTLADDDVDFEQHRAGMVFAFLDIENRAHVIDDLEQMRPYGYSPVALSGTDIRFVEPGLSDRIQGGILLSQERQVRPETLVTGFTKWMLREGVDVRVASPVTGVVRSGGRITGVQIPDGILEGDEFVIAAGAYSGHVARSFGQRVPMEAGKGYSLHFEPPPVEISACALSLRISGGSDPVRASLPPGRHDGVLRDQSASRPEAFGSVARCSVPLPRGLARGNRGPGMDGDAPDDAGRAPGDRPAARQRNDRLRPRDARSDPGPRDRGPGGGADRNEHRTRHPKTLQPHPLFLDRIPRVERPTRWGLACR